MRNVLVTSIAVGAFVSVVGLPHPAVADEILIIGGDVTVTSPSSGIDLPGFLLTGADSSFEGVVCCGPILGPNSGGPTNLSGTVPLTSLNGVFLEQQIVHGTTYLAFVSGSVTFAATPFVMPPPSA